MEDHRPEQHQTLATWRSLLGGATALIRMGRSDAAIERLNDVRMQMLLAQIFGLPAADPLPEEPTER